MKALSAQKLSELATGIALYDEGRTDAWRELLLTNLGQEKMDAIRVASKRLLDIESVKIEAGRPNSMPHRAAPLHPHPTHRPGGT